MQIERKPYMSGIGLSFYLLITYYQLQANSKH